MSTSELTRLPHGPQFRFVDRVLMYCPGRSAVGCLDLTLPSARPAYDGALPWAYLLEAMVQTCGLLLQEPSAAGSGGAPVLLAGLDRVRWFGSVRKPSRIILRSRCLQRAGPFLRCRCSARRQGGRLLASAEVILQAATHAIRDRD